MFTTCKGGLEFGSADFDDDVCVAGNNDCSEESSESTVTWQSDLGQEYKILVHAVEGDVGTLGGLFDLALFSTTPETTTTDATTTAIATTTDSTTTAVTTTQASVCVVAPKEAAEGCVTNNGLNGCRDPESSFGPANSQAFDTITAGETYCGSVSTYPRQFGFTFDSDNYVLTVPVRRDFKFELKLTGDTFNANLSVRKLSDESQPCGSSSSVFERDTTSEVEQTELLSIGTYKIRVIPNERSGLECGTGKTYSYELKVTEIPLPEKRKLSTLLDVHTNRQSKGNGRDWLESIEEDTPRN